MAMTQRNLFAKQMLLQHTIDAKQQMSDWLQAKIETGDYAYALAQDEETRKMTQVLTQKILNPTPLNSLKSERTNIYVDLGVGVSAFWDEMRTNSAIEIENAMVLDSVLMNVEVGMDENINPKLRYEFLNRAGLNEEQIESLVKLEDVMEFEQKAQSETYTRICNEFGLDMDDPDDRIVIDNLVQDAIQNQDMVCLENTSGMDEASQGRHTYEEMYGVSAEEMYGAFAPDDAYFEGLQFPEYVEEYSMNENSVMYSSMLNFQEVLNDTIENNVEAFQQLDQQMQNDINALCTMDLEALEAFQPQDDMMEQLSFDESDLNFADEMQLGYEK